MVGVSQPTHFTDVGTKGRAERHMATQPGLQTLLSPAVTCSSESTRGAEAVCGPWPLGEPDRGRDPVRVCLWLDVSSPLLQPDVQVNLAQLT